VLQHWFNHTQLIEARQLLMYLQWKTLVWCYHSYAQLFP
jgi:hypothetical protein